MKRTPLTAKLWQPWYQADHDTTAIITKTLTDAEKITALLKEAGQAVTDSDRKSTAGPGTIVVPSYLAKGLSLTP